jgi:uncharacterized protein YndB with AHSA1/START domain
MVGPDGFSTTTSQFDFRPGGVWCFVMHGPDGRCRAQRAPLITGGARDDRPWQAWRLAR